MNFLRKFFPISFKMSKSVGAFVVGIIICVLAPVVVSGGLWAVLCGGSVLISVCISVVAGIISMVPAVGILIGVLLAFVNVFAIFLLLALLAVLEFIVGLYFFVSLILLILDFCKVFDKKDNTIETTAEEVASVAEETPAE